MLSIAPLAIRATSVLFMCDFSSSLQLNCSGRTRKVGGFLGGLVGSVCLVLAGLLLLGRQRFALLDGDLMLALGLRQRRLFLAFHRALVHVGLSLSDFLGGFALGLGHVGLRFRGVLGLVAGAERRRECAGNQHRQYTVHV